MNGLNAKFGYCGLAEDDMDFIVDNLRLNLAYTYSGDVSTYSRMGADEIIKMMDIVFSEHRADRSILGKLEEHLRGRFGEAL